MADRRQEATESARAAVAAAQGVLFELARARNAAVCGGSDWWRAYFEACRAACAGAAEAAELGIGALRRMGVDTRELEARRDELVQALGDAILARGEALS